MKTISNFIQTVFIDKYSFVGITNSDVEQFASMKPFFVEIAKQANVFKLPYWLLNLIHYFSFDTSLYTKYEFFCKLHYKLTNGVYLFYLTVKNEELNYCLNCEEKLEEKIKVIFNNCKND